MTNFYQAENFTEKAQTPTEDGRQKSELWWELIKGVDRVYSTLLLGKSQKEIDEFQSEQEERRSFEPWRYQEKAPRVPAAPAKAVPTDLDSALDYWTPAKPQHQPKISTGGLSVSCGTDALFSYGVGIASGAGLTRDQRRESGHPLTEISVLSSLEGSGSKVDSVGQDLEKSDVVNSHKSAAAELLSNKGWKEYKAERAQKESRIEAAIDKEAEKDQSLTVFGKQAVKRLGHCIVEQDSAGISAITKSLTPEQLVSVVWHLKKYLKDFGVVLKAEQHPVDNGQLSTRLTVCYDHEQPKSYSSSSSNK